MGRILYTNKSANKAWQSALRRTANNELKTGESVNNVHILGKMQTGESLVAEGGRCLQPTTKQVPDHLSVLRSKFLLDMWNPSVIRGVRLLVDEDRLRECHRSAY